MAAAQEARGAASQTAPQTAPHVFPSLQASFHTVSQCAYTMSEVREMAARLLKERNAATRRDALYAFCERLLRLCALEARLHATIKAGVPMPYRVVLDLAARLRAQVGDAVARPLAVAAATEALREGALRRCIQALVDADNGNRQLLDLCIALVAAKATASRLPRHEEHLGECVDALVDHYDPMLTLGVLKCLERRGAVARRGVRGAA